MNFNDMIVIYIWGMVCSSAIGLYLSRKKLNFSHKGNLKLREILKFTLPYGGYAILHTIPRTIDLYIVQFFFSTSASGVYQSAKTLYRFFEEILNASYSLVYAPAVNLFEKRDKKGLNDLMTKSASFLFFVFAFMVLFLETGFSSWLITTFLKVEYHFAIGQFNLMILASLAMPFTLMSVVITAHGKPKLVFIFVFISTLMSVGTYFITGFLGESSLIPLGIIVYNSVFGFLSFIYVNKKLDFKFVQIFRAAKDTWNFAARKFSKS
jgi:O-antigen/teichoic acid export membrane protein